MIELNGKTVFITGGGGGIGAGMAQAFAERGAKIVLADIERGFAEQEAGGLPAAAEVRVIELDVRDLASWQAASAAVGPVDVLCNNAVSRPASEAYVVTHPEYRGMLAARHERILSAFGEPAQPGYSTGPIATALAGS